MGVNTESPALNWTLVTSNGFRACVWGRPLSRQRPQVTLLRVTSVSATLLLLEPAESSESSSVLPLRLQEEPGSGVPASFSGSKGASASAGLLLVSGLQPEDEADSDRAGWCNRAPHSDTGRRETGTRASACQGLVLREPSNLKYYPRINLFLRYVLVHNMSTPNGTVSFAEVSENINRF